MIFGPGIPVRCRICGKRAGASWKPFLAMQPFVALTAYFYAKSVISPCEGRPGLLMLTLGAAFLVYALCFRLVSKEPASGAGEAVRPGDQSRGISDSSP